ncbi:putative phospholipid-transporting ATPase 12 [Nymphaea thermarum]|nr:putative phospholipid-transporting ATPase 12 [Nymphaea thermarum]
MKRNLNLPSIKIESRLGVHSDQLGIHDVFAFIVDGKPLAFALEEDSKSNFLKLAIDCASVNCCRSSPKQNAEDEANGWAKEGNVSFVKS